MNKNGISAIVASILIILVTVVGVAIIWVSVLSIVDEGLVDVNTDVQLSIVSSEGYTVWDSEADLATVQVERKGESEICGLDLIFIVDGNSVSHYEDVVPGVNERRIYYINLSNYSGELSKISVAPVFCDSSVGEVSSELEFGDIPSGDIQELIDNNILEEEDFVKPNGGSGGGDGNNFVIPGSEGDCGECEIVEPLVCVEGENCFYVSVDGAGISNGSLGNEFNLSEAQNYANSNLGTGLIFLLAGGNYGTFYQEDALSRTNWVIWRSDGNAIFDYINIWNDEGSAADIYHSFEDIEVYSPIAEGCSPDSNPWEWPDCMENSVVLHWVSYVNLTGSKIWAADKYLGFEGFDVEDGDNILIDNNEITNMRAGFGGAQLSDLTISNNHIHHLSRGSAISLESDDVIHTENVLIENNYIHHISEYDKDDPYFIPDILYAPIATNDGLWDDSLVAPPFNVNDILVQGDNVGKFIGVKYRDGWDEWRVYVIMTSESKFNSFDPIVASESGITFNSRMQEEKFHVGSILAIHAPGVTIRNNTLHSHQAQGIYFYSGDTYYDMVVENNVLYDIGNYNSFGYLVGPTIIRNNTFIGGVQKDDHVSGDVSQILDRYVNDAMIVDTEHAVEGDVIFSGSGLNDLVLASGEVRPYTGYQLVIEVDRVDTYKWSIDGVEKASGVAFDTSSQYLESGGIFYEKVLFGSVSGHNVGDTWTIDYTDAYDGSGVQIYNNIVVGTYRIGNPAINEFNNIWYSQSSGGQPSGVNSIVAVWKEDGVLHGNPEYFEPLEGFTQYTAEHPFGLNHNPFFVNPGFYTEEVNTPADSLKSFQDRSRVWNYHPLSSSPICDGTRPFAGALPCVDCDEDSTIICSTGLDGVCAAGTRVCFDGSFGSCIQDVSSSTESLNCEDGLDNDCNGKIDCEDDSCDLDPVCYEYIKGFVSHWKFEGDLSDEQGNNLGAAVGSPSFVSGKVGQALLLDGSSYVDVGSDASLNIQDEITVFMWVNIPVPGVKYTLFGGDDWQTPYSVYLRDSPAGLVDFVFNDGVSRNNMQAGYVSFNEWVNVVSVYDGVNYIVYINGEPFTAAVNSFVEYPRAFGKIYLGHIGNVGEDFVGSMDEVMIYNRGLSAVEVGTLYCDQGGTIGC